jgi:hypothetical protein
MIDVTATEAMSYRDAALASNAEAARLLGFMCQHGEPEHWPEMVLVWYLGDRRLAAKIGATSFSTPESRAEAIVTQKEIERIEAILVERGTRFVTPTMAVINRELARWQASHGRRPGGLFAHPGVVLHIRQHAAAEDIVMNELVVASYRGVPVYSSELLGAGRIIVAGDQSDFEAQARSHRG